MSGGASQPKLKEFGGKTPLGRPDQPAELGSIYVQLAAGDASYANGQVYGAVGGTGSLSSLHTLMNGRVLNSAAVGSYSI